MLEEGRAVGNTTRQVDEYIQMLFNHPNQEFQVLDHWFKSHTGTSKKVNEYLYKRIRDRYEFEHGRYSNRYYKLNYRERNGDCFISLDTLK